VKSLIKIMDKAVEKVKNKKQLEVVWL
jgi:hypothetical protein